MQMILLVLSVILIALPDLRTLPLIFILLVSFASVAIGVFFDTHNRNLFRKSVREIFFLNRAEGVLQRGSTLLEIVSIALGVICMVQVL
jgi:hypothetical protein